ncbi:zinc-dependent metalloprotease [soil metagenome]
MPGSATVRSFCRAATTAAVLFPGFGCAAAPADARTPAPVQTPPQAQTAMSDTGFLPVRIDHDGNRVYLRIPEGRLGEDFLHTITLATGLGSSNTLLDRGQTGSAAVVRLERRGNRVHMVRDNLSIRAIGADEAGVRAAREGFPTSVIASFPIESEEGDGIEVDATSFFMADVWGVADRLRGGGQGTSRVDRDRSWVVEESSGVFPRNTELRVALTFVGDQPGIELRRTAPDGSAATFEQHHSLVALPDSEGFRPRVADLRAGLFGPSYWDFSQGFDQNYRGAYTSRWRLIPSDTAAYLRGELVTPVEPIVYYVDPGIPEPYRTNFIEGGNWWSEIFEAAGFRDAFLVTDLPEGANPLDIRYNMLYWVHRQGPGPSVGPSYSDPRTGEILKTVVRMDSWRSLVDYNIYAGLLPAAGDAGLSVSAEDFVMARRRQHTAHEIGHTVGIAHNFISASQGRASVMDYPAPLIHLRGDGTLDLTEAYREGGGAWDSLAVRYAYTWYPDETREAAGLRQIVEDGLGEGLRFITGGHAGQSGSIPAATQWIEGATMLEALERTGNVRRHLVERFDERAIAEGEAMSMLNMRFAHVYLHHRYALEGAIKYLGGMDFTYALRGDGQTPAQVLPAAEQREALARVLAHLQPAELRIPDRIANLIPPSPPGMDGSEIWIPSRAGTAFDAITLAGGLATEIVEGLLHRDRLARVALFHARDAGTPSVSEVLEAVMAASWDAGVSGDAMDQALRRTVQTVVLNTLMDLGGDARVVPEVRAPVDHALERLGNRLAGASGGGATWTAHRAAAARSVARYFAGEDDPATRSRFPVVPLPWP